MNIGSNSIHWGCHLLTLPISTYVTEGLASMNGLELLRHGTSFLPYMNILQKGGNPRFGGRTSNEAAFDEGTREQAAQCKGYFYVFKDSEAHLVDPDTNIDSRAAGMFIKRVYPRMHATLAGAYYAKDVENRILRYALKFFYGLISCLFCPTIRFAVRKEEIRSSSERTAPFENDPDYGGVAYRTRYVLANDRIGLIGTCKQMTWNDVKRTFTNTPGKALLGVVQLIVGIAFTIMGLGLIL